MSCHLAAELLKNNKNGQKKMRMVHLCKIENLIEAVKDLGKTYKECKTLLATHKHIFDVLS
jgi:hypothetical protein